MRVLSQKGIDAAIITDPKHIYYFTGFSTPWPRQTALLVLTPPDYGHLFVGEQLGGEARKAYDGEVVTFEDYDLKKRIIAYGNCVAQEFGKFLFHSRLLANSRAIGLEDWHMPHVYFEVVSEAAPRARYTGISDIILSYRKTKGKDELANIREATRRLELAYNAAKANIKIGTSEKELCRDVMGDSIVRDGTFEFSRGDTWLSGERTLEIGGPPSARRFQDGDGILLDLQAVYNGYWADGARTYILGKPSSEQERIFGAILAAKKKGEELLRPGTICKDVYAAIANEIDKAGYGKLFPHHAGHGLGLEDQEGPFFIPGCWEELEEGVVCTIEPGIYHPKIGGFRDEDTYIITKDGFERITIPPGTLEQLG